MDVFLTNEYIGLYFFSAVFQGNMALLALAGVFAVYRIQSLDGQIETQTSRLFEYVAHRSLHLDSREVQTQMSGVFTASLLHERLETWKTNTDKNFFADNLRTLAMSVFNEKARDFDSVQSLVSNRRSTIGQMRLPFLLTLVTIVVSLLGLCFAHPLHNSHRGMEATGIFLTVLLQLVSLFATTRFIFLAIRTDGHNQADEN